MSEITERVFYSGRKAVAPKEVTATIAAWEEEVREYKMLTGLEVDNNLMMLNLKRILPVDIEEMLQTVEISEYALAKEYALKQARVLSKKKGNKPLQLDLNEDEEETPKKKVQFEEEPPQEPESYTKDELLAWLGKGSSKGGKGGKGKEGKGSKGSFPGTCYHCGAYGHRVSECRKKDAEMKGKGKGQGFQQTPVWGNPNPFKGKGKGNKGAWSPGKGAWGKGGKGAYGLDDDWSEGFSGYSYGFHGDIEALSLSQEWETPHPRKTFQPEVKPGRVPPGRARYPPESSQTRRSSRARRTRRETRRTPRRRTRRTLRK